MVKIPQDVNSIARLCSIFGNPRRLMLLLFLKGVIEKSVIDIEKELKIPQSELSQYLNLMYKNRYVKYRKSGKFRYYCLNRVRFNELMTIILSLKYVKEEKSARRKN